MGTVAHQRLRVGWAERVSFAAPDVIGEGLQHSCRRRSHASSQLVWSLGRSGSCDLHPPSPEGAQLLTRITRMSMRLTHRLCTGEQGGCCMHFHMCMLKTLWDVMCAGSAPQVLLLACLIHNANAAAVLLAQASDQRVLRCVNTRMFKAIPPNRNPPDDCWLNNVFEYGSTAAADVAIQAKRARCSFHQGVRRHGAAP